MASFLSRLEGLGLMVEAIVDAATRSARTLMRNQVEPLWHAVTGATHGLLYVRHSLRGNNVTRESLEKQHDPKNPPILLLHGFLGTRGAMAVLESRLREDGRVIFSFNLGTLNIWDIRRSAFFIHRKIESLANQVGIDRVDVVAHSMGGLIALYYIKRLGGAKRVRKLIMLGTPHRGTWGALLGVVTLGLISSSTWQMLPESLFLRDLAEGPLPPGVEYYSLYAEFDWLTPPSSARLAGTRQISVPLGHSSLVMSDAVYRRIDRALKE